MHEPSLQIALAVLPFLLLLLFGGHAVADYGQQSAYVAEFKVRPMPKDRAAALDAEAAAAGREPAHRIARNPDWFVTLGAHCLIHAVVVGAIAFAFLFLGRLALSGGAFGMPMILGAASVAAWLGWAEFAIHFLIDDAKGQQRFSYRADQALHYSCKVAWAAVILCVI